MHWLLDWRRLLIYTHRWLGIAGGVVFVAWFVSGIVMMYERIPRLTAEERLARLPPLDLAAVKVAPADAAARAGITPERMRVAMLDDRPVYRFLEGDRWTTVFADTGETLRGIDAEAAVALMRRFVPEHASTITHDARLEDSDQWTLSALIRAHMPVQRVALGDPAGTRLYVSERTGEAVMKTTTRSRFWGYLGAVIHYTYFTPFRRQTEFWTQSIIYGALIGAVMCILGLVVGVWRYSLSRRFRHRGTDATSHSPYAGLMMWHHYAGLIFGLATFTWALSGALSLNPWNWAPGTGPTSAQRQAVAGGPLRLDAFTPERLRGAAAAIAGAFAPKELEAIQFAGEPYLMANRPPSMAESDRWISTDLTAFLSPQLGLDHRIVHAAHPERGAFSQFPAEAVMTAARVAMPDTAIEDAVWLEEYDTYYYDRRRTRTLPVLRVRYLDPERTWLYLDPRHGLIAYRQERLSRLNRWLYHGLHDLDFPFMYYRRPLWDIVVILLSLGGIALSLTTMVAAWARLRRHARRVRNAFARPDSQPIPAAGRASPGGVISTPLPAYRATTLNRAASGGAVPRATETTTFHVPPIES